MNDEGECSSEAEGILGSHGDRPPDRGKQKKITDFWSVEHRLHSLQDPGEAPSVQHETETDSARNIAKGTEKQFQVEATIDALPVLRDGGIVQREKSYATVTKRTLPNIENLPDPIHAGPLTKVVIPQEAYEEKLQSFDFALIGRVNFRYISMNDVRSAAKEAWNLKGSVTLAPLGKGFILLRFEIEGDMSSMWKRGPVKVKGQVIRFQRWRPEFSIHDDHTQTKLVWIRYPELPMEYWHERILLSMAKASGRPVEIDRRTRNATMGSYARILVEVEIGGSRVEEIQVERKQPRTNTLFWFKQRILYEDEIDRCFFCKKLGHSINQCREKKDKERSDEGLRGDAAVNLDQGGGGRTEDGQISTATNPDVSCDMERVNLEGYIQPLLIKENTINNGDLPMGDSTTNLDGSMDRNQGDLEIFLPISHAPTTNAHDLFMVDNPLGEGGYGYGSDPAESDFSPSEKETQASEEENMNKAAGPIMVGVPENTGSEKVQRKLRPRKNRVSYTAARGGRTQVRGGKSGRTQNWGEEVHVVSSMASSQYLGGKMIIQHQEIAELDNAICRAEEESRKGKTIAVTGQASRSDRETVLHG
ncbi:uncharacterized protein LOC122063868 [Macadamia integrifolia]|uniref:uncharacterized protein LOC122063868 n=1 Tax=Macadamia integrifolia TaxID=60698 RepID=UPI001C4E7C1E|nr:uncharacterized protein LOC122063868 [Macadamia integrifolia]